ncbi:hypothetical protein BHE74_00026973 [Ensete ventricosum]|nr:hypothetical protein GW17_00014455 [Ensete ventricosum]RWW65709.1 hypothetical protein BHE74_00026973 [Ensete ventricosum]RZS18839.1 hypothetical protein BHM03_00051161 [Ensete ventricosum]
MTTHAEVKRDLRAAGCGGDGCGTRDPWPLHHVRHRTVFCRLCTSCVLRYHPGSFCTSCFDLLLDGGTSPVVRCSGCPAIAHSVCLPNPAASFVCPSCSDLDGSPYFSLGGEKSIDLKSAKVLLAAAKLAAVSMGRAASSTRADAERKVREAAVARKRAREALEKVLLLSQTEKEKKNKETDHIAAPDPRPEVMDPKKKMPKLSSTVAAMVGQKRVQNRERDRWMRFQEPIGMAQTPVQGSVEATNKVDPLIGMQNHVMDEEAKGRLTSLAHAPNPMGQVVRDETGVLKASQGGLVKEEGVVGAC